MSSEVRRRTGGRSERVRLAVTAATVEVMAEKGIADFSIGDVAARSGVHETSITRDNLAIETLLGYSEQQIPVPDTGSIRSDLLELLGAVTEYLTSPVGKALAQAMAFAGEDSRWTTIRAEFWLGRLILAAAIVDRAVERGEIPTDTDPRLVLEALVAPLSFRAIVTREPIDGDLCHRLVDLALDGILPRN